MRAGAAAGALTLREEVRAADAGAIAALVAATGFFNEAEIAIARELAGERLAKGPASGYAFVLAESAGGCGGPGRDQGKDSSGMTLAGYACYGPVPATHSSWTLYWIVVAPAWQKHGAGRLLLDRVQARVRAAGGERLYAETSSREQYAPTRAFYVACGFMERAFLPDHFAPGDGKLVLEKALSDEAGRPVAR